jgi:hypothetical protein
MRLRHSTTTQDDISEALASSFVQSSAGSHHTFSNGTGSGTGTPTSGKEIDEFVNEFKDLRKVYHKRVMWGEKWAAGQVSWRDD